MPRRPSSVYLPEGNPREAIRQLNRFLQRSLVESFDIRELVFPIGALGHGQTYVIGGGPSFLPPRNRIFRGVQIAFQVLFDPGGAGVGAAARNSIQAVLYVNSQVSGNRIFDLTVGPSAGSGWKSGQQTTVVNDGKQNLTTSDTWGLVINGFGGAGNAAEHVSVGIAYEDFSPHSIDRASS